MLTGDQESEIRRRAEEQVRIEVQGREPTADELRMQNEELLRSERELQRSRREYETLFESAPIGYFVLNKQGTIQDVNRYGANLLQADRKYLYEKPFIVFVPRESHEQFYVHLQRVFDENRLQSHEMPITDRRGSKLWARFESRLQMDENGVARCFMAVIDVSDRKRVEDDLILAREDAVQASKAKSLFLANMSHEIRTPMNAIMAMAELSLEAELAAEQREWLEVIHSSATELTRIIADVLDFSRIEANKLSIESQPFDLEETLTEIDRRFTQQAEEKNLEFAIVRAQDLHRWYRGDQFRIRQVLYNLLSNAVKFTTDGQVTLEVRSESISEHLRQIVFVVRDTGIGIRENAQTSVFESFYQADSSYAKTYQGTGLGLAISRRLAKLMSGQLYFQSSEGAGTQFTFVIPLPIEAETVPADNAAEGYSKRPARAAERDSRQTQTARVLVAEDNTINVLVMRTVLERAGYEVTTVGSGDEVLRELSAGTFDIALMDISMPIVDGVEATRRIRAGEVLEENQGIPVVAITAHSMQGDREQFLSQGMDGYMSKPFSKQKMLELVGQILSERRDIRYT